MEHTFSQLTIGAASAQPCPSVNGLVDYTAHIPMILGTTERLSDYVSTNMDSTNAAPDGNPWGSSEVLLHRQLVLFLTKYRWYTQAAAPGLTPLFVRGRSLTHLGPLWPRDVADLANHVATLLDLAGYKPRIYKVVDFEEELYQDIDLGDELRKMAGAVWLTTDWNLAGNDVPRFMALLSILAVRFIDGCRVLFPRVWEAVDGTCSDTNAHGSALLTNKCQAAVNQLTLPSLASLRLTNEHQAGVSQQAIRHLSPALRQNTMKRLGIGQQTLDDAHKLCEYVAGSMTGKTDRNGNPWSEQVTELHVQMACFLRLALAHALLEGDLNPKQAPDGKEVAARFGLLVRATASHTPTAVAHCAMVLRTMLALSRALPSPVIETLGEAVHGLSVTTQGHGGVRVTGDWRLVGERADEFLAGLGRVMDLAVRASKQGWPEVWAAADRRRCPL